MTQEVRTDTGNRSGTLDNLRIGIFKKGVISDLMRTYFGTSLYVTPTDLDNVVVVKLTDNIQLPDFVVRMNVVLNALVWLKENNPNYFDFKIDYEKLNCLPDHGNVYSQLNSIKSDCNNNTESDNEDTDDYETLNLIYTDVPDVNQPSLRKSSDNVLVWPSIGKTPVNEFSSPGYLSMAFPHLFCYGKGDYSMPMMHKVSLSDYIKHLMLYEVFQRLEEMKNPQDGRRGGQQTSRRRFL
ncbi:ADP-dependent (S)-NAD(P)H-hydrate dehydratase [Frankliniella fusca]|uniref:ADP-dependent (S)-NAD(P)H-hydrate dehydratase n=1 Tax=Frankliniella fusca TaxID=407009 RepID=A0AAE1HKE4_9NEOP|nr:ADP-dependent (S)-NAD(P)H-hydrate dehydratase [Frankliniella fusca]